MLLQDVHNGLDLAEGTTQGQKHFCHGSYSYYHYCCDGVDDKGWGCGYRTLQTMCSWLRKQGYHCVRDNVKEVPSLYEIQMALVDMQDKSEDFKGSKQWIGSFEACLCLDYFYDVPCKIIHLNEGRDMVNHLEDLAQHFQKTGCPVMMGGETDCASKGIVGVRLENPALLIVDPHCPEMVSDVNILQDRGYVKWMPISDLHAESFYNLCLPKPALQKR